MVGVPSVDGELWPGAAVAPPAAGAGAFLELLARDAPVVEYERPLVEARARREPPAVLAELDRAKLLALGVRSTLERRRRREAELTALYETAGDLASLRDLDAVLRAIVERARRLLGTDVTYLTLRDRETGDTHMRVTDGSVSARFQRLRLPVGAGLGGRVAQLAMPYASANYPTDDRFRHTREIDDAVTEEGLVAILGVPLRLGSEVIGVLFAADRSERPFARDEVLLLGSLADHAAVAIDNARLLAETRTALEELGSANALVRAHSESVERAAAAHDRFAHLVLRGGGVEEVADAVTDVLGRCLTVVDADGRVLVRTAGSGGRAGADAADAADDRDGDGAAAGVEARTLDEAVASSRALGRAVRAGSQFVVAVAAGPEQLGALVLDGAEEVEEADRRILERAALVTALLLLFRRSVGEAEARVRGELLGDLLAAPDRDPEGLRERARRLGADLDAPHTVVVAAAEGPAARRLTSAAAPLARTRGGLAGSHGGRVVLLLPAGDASAVAAGLAAELSTRAGGPVTVGAAAAPGGPAGVAAAHVEAVRCLDALVALGRRGCGGTMADLGFLGLVLGDSRDVGGFVRATIGPLLDYDERRGTALVQTVEEFFRCGGSPIRTREALHVHVNTVTQRLERVGRLLGEDWNAPGRAVEVQLALRLHRARASEPTPATSG